MSFLIGVFRFLLVLFVVRLLLRGLAALFRPSRPSRVAPPAGVELVRDRVCNTFLPRDRALHAVLGGRDEHFCSERCRDLAREKLRRAS